MKEEIRDFYTITQFARKLSLHVNTVRRAIKSGRICAFRIGTDKKGCFRIPHSEIDRIMMFDLKRNVMKIIEMEKG